MPPLQEQDERHNEEVKYFLAKLNDRSADDPRTLQSFRAEMATQLGHLRDTLAVRPLIEVLVHDEYPDVRASAA